MIETGIQTRFPAVYSVLPDNTPLLFAFSRARIGITYFGHGAVSQGQYVPIPGEHTPATLGALADIPAELMTAIMSSINSIETSPNPQESLRPWREELHSATSRIRAEEACLDCGRVHVICLASLRGVRNVSQGISCPQLGITCLRAIGAAWPPTSAPAPLPPPLAAALPAPAPFGPGANDPTHFRIGTPRQQTT